MSAGPSVWCRAFPGYTYQWSTLRTVSPLQGSYHYQDIRVCGSPMQVCRVKPFLTYSASIIIVSSRRNLRNGNCACHFDGRIKLWQGSTTPPTDSSLSKLSGDEPMIMKSVGRNLKEWEKFWPDDKIIDLPRLKYLSSKLSLLWGLSLMVMYIPMIFPHFCVPCSQRLLSAVF